MISVKRNLPIQRLLIDQHRARLLDESLLGSFDNWRHELSASAKTYLQRSLRGFAHCGNRAFRCETFLLPVEFHRDRRSVSSISFQRTLNDIRRFEGLWADHLWPDRADTSSLNIVSFRGVPKNPGRSIYDDDPILRLKVQLRGF
jgi:hypothetical protein